VTHSGPTAEHYHSALERYVEAMAGNRSHTDEQSAGTRLSFPPLTVSDVMSRAVVTAYPGAAFKEIARALDRNAINAVPVVDEEHRVIGVVTASDLLQRVGHTRPVPRGHRLGGHAENSRKEHGTTAKELMTAPAITASPRTSIGDAARQLAKFRIRCMPVVDRDGVLIGMVARGDLIRLFLRSDEEIAGDVVRDVIRSSTTPGRHNVRVEVSEGVVTLSGRVDTALTAHSLAHKASRVSGVVDVRDHLDFDINDDFLPTGR
jgi:CBS domain-containing protein